MYDTMRYGSCSLLYDDRSFVWRTELYTRASSVTCDVVQSCETQKRFGITTAQALSVAAAVLCATKPRHHRRSKKLRFCYRQTSTLKRNSEVRHSNQMLLSLMPSVSEYTVCVYSFGWFLYVIGTRALRKDQTVFFTVTSLYPWNSS